MRFAFTGEAPTVELTSDHHYRFDLTPTELWSVLGATGDYQSWWPWLREFAAAGLESGDEWACVVRPPLPYSLRFMVALQEVIEPARIVATVSGDISGGAQLDIEADGAGCTVRLRSSLTPSSSAFRLAATMLRPIARWGHDWVIDNGARQFGAVIAR